MVRGERREAREGGRGRSRWPACTRVTRCGTAAGKTTRSPTPCGATLAPTSSSPPSYSPGEESCRAMASSLPARPAEASAAACSTDWSTCQPKWSAGETYVDTIGASRPSLSAWESLHKLRSAVSASESRRCFAQAGSSRAPLGPSDRKPSPTTYVRETHGASEFGFERTSAVAFAAAEREASRSSAHSEGVMRRETRR